MSPLGPGQIFANRFEIDRIAGSGGMGTVYRARDRYSGDIVALKLLHGSGGRAGEVERFRREAQLLAELRHPGIVSYIADGLTPDGQRFLAMEWLDGEDLASRLARGPLLVGETISLLRSVADALSAAHRRNIVHRDLKPTNLFLVRGQLTQVKILDFGVARRAAVSRVMTQTGSVVGTPGYMAPEQGRGVRDLLPAADIFSLGCVLYECLAGEPPFAAEHVAAVLVRILFEEPVPISRRRAGIPEPVIGLLAQMLKKDPHQRLPDAMSLLDRLDEIQVLTEMQTLPTLATSPRKPSPFAESEQVLFSLVMAADPHTSSVFHAEVSAADGRPSGEADTGLLATVRTMGVRAEIMADGALVATVPPSGNATDQAAIAARVALYIKDRWPQAVVTVATGRGAARGQSAVGEIADLAVLLLQRGRAARTGPHSEVTSGVWLDELSARLLGPRFMTHPTAAGTLLIGEDREVDEDRPLLGKPTPCVGRDAELAMLEGQLNSSVEEEAARLMLLSAQPGIGKTRLRHEFLRRVQRRSEPVTVIDGRGDLISAGAPYAILASAIRRLCGLTGSEPPAEQQQRLRDRVSIHVPAPEAERVAAFLAELCSIPCAVPGTECESLRAARQNPKLMRSGLADAFLDWLRAECAAAPVLLILDDLQWSDAISIALVGDAVKALRDAPLFVLAFARPEVHAVFPKLWSGCGLAEYALKPLSKRACERLVQQVLGHAHLTPSEIAQAVEQAAGNALFLEEIIRALSEGKPASASATVTAMLQARIGRMEHGPRRVARAAAVFGQTFWRGGVAAILGLSATSMELDEWFTALVAAEMIQPHPSSQVNNDLEYGFRHAFMRDAAYSLLTEGDLLTGHRLAAEYLAACEERDSAAAQSSEAKPYREALAYHYQQAQMFDEACATLMRAGDSMLRLGALAEARARYGAALAMTDKLQDSQHNRRSQIDVLLRMVQTGMLAEKDEELFPRLERARALLKGLGDPNELSAEDRLRMARLNSLYGHIHYYRGQTPEAIGYYQKVLPIAQEAGDPELLAVPAYMIGVTFAVRGHTRRAEPLLAQAIEPLSRYGNPVDWLRAVLYYGHALMAMGRYDAGRVQLDRGHARALELNNPELVAMSYAVRCSFFRTCGDWPETIACADKTVELAEQLKNPFFASVACAYKGWAQSYLGQDEAATANRARALELAATLKGPTMLSSWFAAADCEIALNAGRYQQAIERAQALLPRLKAAGEFLAEIVTERALVMARAIQDQGELDEPMDTSRRVLTDSGNLLEAARTHLWWGRAGLLRGAAAAARHHFALAATQFADAGCAYPQAEAQRLLDRLAPA